MKESLGTKPAEYSSNWEEGRITTDCLIDLDNLRLSWVEKADTDFDDLEILINEEVDVVFGNLAHTLEAKDGQLTEKGVSDLKDALSGKKTFSE